MKQIALVGMPNCGKSSLYNLITGKHAHTGNRAGVTVARESAQVRFTPRSQPIRVVDLPGIRSLSPTSDDERETFRALKEDPPDLILFVCDATAPFVHLSLLCALIKNNFQKNGNSIPIAVAFNFCDELDRFPSSSSLTDASKLPSVAVSARTGQGLGELRALLQKMINEPIISKNQPSLSEIQTILGKPRKQTRIAKFADKLFLSPISGYPLFFLLFLGILFAVFGSIGNTLTDLLHTVLLDPLFAWVERLLSAAPEWLSSMIQNGMLGGIGAVLDFLPRLLLLFLSQSILEQIGLLSRLSKLADPLMRRFGLRGDAVAPIFLGFGCTVSAVLCTRTMKDPHARARCTCHLPVIACSARIPLCAVIAKAYFGSLSWLVCVGIWLLSGFSFLLLCALSNSLSRQKSSPCRHEDPLPRWRFPTLSETIAVVCENLRHFLSRASGVILLTSLLIWLLSNIDLHFRFVGETGMEESLLASISRMVAPLLFPMGLGDWRIAAALLSGIGAKEATLSTLRVLISTPLAESGLLDTASALAFLIFYTLYFPCTATLATLRAEKKRTKQHLLPSLLFSTVLAYLLGCAIYMIAKQGNF